MYYDVPHDSSNCCVLSSFRVDHASPGPGKPPRSPLPAEVCSSSSKKPASKRKACLNVQQQNHNQSMIITTCIESTRHTRITVEKKYSLIKKTAHRTFESKRLAVFFYEFCMISSFLLLFQDGFAGAKTQRWSRTTQLSFVSGCMSDVLPKCSSKNRDSEATESTGGPRKHLRTSGPSPSQAADSR